MKQYEIVQGTSDERKFYIINKLNKESPSISAEFTYNRREKGYQIVLYEASLDHLQTYLNTKKLVANRL